MNRHALSWEDFQQALRHHLQLESPSLKAGDADAIRAAGERVVREGRLPDSLRSMALLVKHVELMLDIEFPRAYVSPLSTPSMKLRRFLVTVFACALAAPVAYVVVGGLAAGESHLITRPLPALLIFLGLLTLLAAVEALHISVVILRLKDLYESRSQYPRTYRLYRAFRTEEGTRRFLAGRQFIVIVTVFFIAQLTSFPHMRMWPLTDEEFPRWMSQWFTNVFLGLGVAGALLTLWVGQLAPQFIANRRPQAFMNLPPITWLFQLALIVESLGLTRPGEWLARWAREEPRIPVSPQERYRQAVEQIEGFGTLGIRKAWELGKNRARVGYASSAVFNKGGIKKVVDAGLVLRLGSPKDSSGFRMSLAWEQSLHAVGSAQSDAVVGEVVHEDRVEGWRLFRRELKPRFGAFKEGQILRTSAVVEFQGDDPGEDVFLVSGPTKYLLFRLRVVGSPYQVSEARVRVYRAGSLEQVAARGALEVVHERQLDVMLAEDGTAGVEYTVYHPDVGTVHHLTWSAEWA